MPGPGSGPALIRAMKIRKGGVTSFVEVPIGTTYATWQQPTTAQLAGQKSSLSELGTNWNLVPNAGGGNGGNYTGTVAMGNQSDTTVLNAQATSINLTNRSFLASNSVNFQADPGQTVQSLINSQGFENGPIDGLYAVGWPYVYHTWSLNPGIDPQLRRGDQYRRGQSVLTVL